jgi:hypothetical protein
MHTSAVRRAVKRRNAYSVNISTPYNSSKNKQNQQQKEEEEEEEELTENQFVVNAVMAAISAYVVYNVYEASKWPDACQVTMDAASRTPLIREHVGLPVKVSFFWGGTVNPEDAVLELPLTGPKGHAKVFGRVRKNAKGKWIIQSLNAQINDNHQFVSLIDVEFMNTILAKEKAKIRAVQRAKIEAAKAEVAAQKGK